MAVSRCVLVIGWGAPLDVRDPRGPSGGATVVASFAAGLSDSYVDTVTAPGTAEGVQVMLDPLVAARILGRPFGEVANRVVAARPTSTAPRCATFAPCPRDSAPPRAGASGSRCSTGRSAPGCRHPAIRTRGWPAPGGACAHSGGAVPVDALAAEAGWSRRHLGAVFRRELGLPPKVLARLVRFERAHGQAGRAARPRAGPPSRPTPATTTRPT